MAKPKTINYYERQFVEAITSRHGSYNPVLYGLIVHKAAMDFHLMDRYIEELDKTDFVIMTQGSMSQIKQEAHPLLGPYDKCSRTCQAVLDSLQLTPQSTYKKVDSKPDANKTTPMEDYLTTLIN